MKLSHNLEISDQINLGKSEVISRLNRDLLGYTNSVAFSWFNGFRDGNYAPVHEFVKQHYKTCSKPVLKLKYYNMAQYDFMSKLSRIENQIFSYGRWILSKINEEIEYKDGKMVLYAPKRKVIDESNYGFIGDNEAVIQQISEKLEVLGMNSNEISEFLSGISRISLSQKVELKLSLYPHLKPRKYYFRSDFSSEKIVVEDVDKYYTEALYKLFVKHDILRYIVKSKDKDWHGKFKIRGFESLDIVIVSSLTSVKYSKSGLTDLTDTKSLLCYDTENDNYFLKIVNPYSSKIGETIRIPIKYSKKFHTKFGKDVSLILHLGADNENYFKIVHDAVENTNQKLKGLEKLASANKRRVVGIDLGIRNFLTATVVEIDSAHKIPTSRVKDFKQIQTTYKHYKVNPVAKLSLKQDKFIEKQTELQEKINELKSQFPRDEKNKIIKDSPVTKEINRELKIIRKKIEGKDKSHRNHIINKLIIEAGSDSDIIIEKLNIKRSVQKKSRGSNRNANYFFKYGLFRKDLEYKLELLKRDERFSSLFTVNNQGTSMFCSQCGHYHYGDRNEDIFKCSKCHTIMDSDDNASENMIIWYLNGFIVDSKKRGKMVKLDSDGT